MAIHTNSPSLEGLLDFYLAHRIHAVCSAFPLVYCPPLLDILPMYMIFLLATPVALYVGSRWSWKLVLTPSSLIWALAQFGLRTTIHANMVHLAGLQIPLNEMGAFDLLAWQFLWVGGLWIGAGRAGSIFKVLTSKTSVILAVLVAAAFLLRHPILHLRLDGELWSGFINKWHLGALRRLDFLSFAILFAVSRPWPARWFTISPLLLLGKASLECSVRICCSASLLFLFCKGRNRFAAWIQSAFIATTLIGLYMVARLFVNARTGTPRNKTRSALPAGYKPSYG